MELLVVMVLAAVLAALSIPSMGGMISRGYLEKETEYIAGTIMTSRVRAMEKGFPFRLNFDESKRSFTCFGDDNSNGKRDEGERLLGPFKLGHGVVFGSVVADGPNNTEVPDDGISFIDNCLVFNNIGSSNAGTVYLKKDERTSAIRVMPASGTVVCWIYDGIWRKK